MQRKNSLELRQIFSREGGGGPGRGECGCPQRLVWVEFDLLLGG